MLQTTNYKLQTRAGFGLIEVLAASSVIAFSLVALVTASQLSSKVISENSKRVRAEFLAEEGVEAVRTMRDRSWLSAIAPLSVGTRYVPLFATSTSQWSLNGAGGTLVDGIFTRTVTFQSVYRRNTDDAIVSSTSPESKILNAGTREVVSSVVWGGTKEVEIRSYITDLFKN